MTPLLVRMPKTGSTSAGEWLHAHAQIRTHGHKPAVGVRHLEPGRPLWGIVRAPLDWYVSLYLHIMRGYPSNSRSLGSLMTWGRGSVDFADVLWGWTHPESVRPRTIDRSTRLSVMNTAGDQLGSMDGGLWTRSMRWYFCEHPPGSTDGLCESGRDIGRLDPHPGSESWHWPWAVDELVPMVRVEAYLHETYGARAPLERLNAAESHGQSRPEITVDMVGWVAEADGVMMGRGLMKSWRQP